MIPDSLAQSICEYLSDHVSPECAILGDRYLSGGSINEAYALNTSCGKYFMKYNSSDKYPGMFETEAKGLSLLADSKTVKVPQVFTTCSEHNYSYILLEFQDQAPRSEDYWHHFSGQLAALHSFTSNEYGLDHDNYIGSLSQSNKHYKNYYDFLINTRYTPLIIKARNADLLSPVDVKHFEKFFNQLPDLLPTEEPTLIHGDLWSGNLISDRHGSPFLIDPAVYYGNREFDIAMTKLFGGFPSYFYAHYNECFPMIKGWETRIEINQLYPLLVHVVLFGMSYVYQVQQIIRKYTV